MLELEGRDQELLVLVAGPAHVFVQELAGEQGVLLLEGFDRLCYCRGARIGHGAYYDGESVLRMRVHLVDLDLRFNAAADDLIAH